MNTIKTISGNSVISAAVFSGSPAQTSYVWKNLVIEKRISINWIDTLYRHNPLHAFWTVLSSPMN